MEISKEKLDAYVDGELPPREMERIAAMLATRPDLEAYVAQQEKLRCRLKLDAVLAAPLPDRLLNAVHRSPVSWRWRISALLRRDFMIRSLVPAGLALAAGLLIGTALQPAKELSLSGSGQIVAQGGLGRALDTKLAAAGYDGQGARIGISFRNHAGEDCRTFTSGSTAGMACHHDGGWVVATLVTQSPQASGGYRMVGSEMPDTIRRAVKAAIDGAPYDADAEARARARGWSKD